MTDPTPQLEQLGTKPLRSVIPLRKRKILKYTFRRVSKLVLTGIVIIAALLWLFESGIISGSSPELSDRILAWGAAIVVLAGALRMVRETLHFLTYFYDIQGGNILIRKGIITKHEVILPFSRVTDVWVDQDFWDAMLGLYDIHLATPTQESMRAAHINGLDRRGAQKLRELLLNKIAAVSSVENDAPA
jgi:membrane protein YdbS with pleckstrin-like domain